MVQTFLIQGCWNGCSVGVSSTVLRIWACERLVDIQIGFVTDHRDKATDESKRGRDEGLGLLLHKTLLEGKRDVGCTCLWQQSLHTRGEDLKDLVFSVHLKQWTLSTVVCCVGGVRTQAHLFKHLPRPEVGIKCPPQLLPTLPAETGMLTESGIWAR